MASFQYYPLNDSCLVYDNKSKVYSDLMLDDSMKKKYNKTLAMLQQGSIKDIDNNIYKPTSHCVIPKETSDFFGSASGFIDTDKDVNKIFPKGSYVNNGSSSFSSSVTEFTNLIEKTNTNELISLNNKIENYKIRNSNYRFITLSNALIKNNNTSNTFLKLNSECDGIIADFNNTTNYVNNIANVNINNSVNTFNNRINNYNNRLSSINNRVSKCAKETPVMLSSGLNRESCFEILGFSNNRTNGGNFVQLAVNKCHSNVNQQWVLDSKNRLKSSHMPNHCLDIAWGNTNNGAKLIMWPCHDGNNQKWDFNPVSRAYVSRHDNRMCLDTPNVEKNREPYIWRCHNGPQQVWNSYPIKSFSQVQQTLLPNYDPTLPAFFSSIGYTGNFISLTKGEYILSTLRQISKNFSWQNDINDRIQSIYIPSGYNVFVYQHDLFRGIMKNFTGSIYNLQDHGFLNQISSIIIR